MITGELRELAHVFSNVWLDKDGSVTYTTGTSAPSLESVNLEEYIKGIADRIDAEYDKTVCELNDLASSGISLPVDADGVPIRVGDVMEWPTTGETFEVVGIGDGVLFYVEDGSEQADWTGASTKRHYHAPTVEDVLREFAYGLGVPVADSYVAACAAKLQLAGDAE